MTDYWTQNLNAKKKILQFKLQINPIKPVSTNVKGAAIRTSEKGVGLGISRADADSCQVASWPAFFVFYPASTYLL